MKLERPLVFFDLETTGIDVVDDRIIQLGVSKIVPDGELIEVKMMFNPGRPIPPASTTVHGITDADVAMSPTFKDKAAELYASFKGSDLGGFNIIGFDVPMLSEHFLRYGFEYPEKDTKFLDAMKIYRRNYPRNLEAAYSLYCGKKLEGAHDAMADTIASREVFFRQIEVHPDIGDTVDKVHDYCTEGNQFADFARKLKYDEDGEVCFAFGKNDGRRVTFDSETIGYARWMLNGNFPEYTKLIINSFGPSVMIDRVVSFAFWRIA